MTTFRNALVALEYQKHEALESGNRVAETELRRLTSELRTKVGLRPFRIPGDLLPLPNTEKAKKLDSNMSEETLEDVRKRCRNIQVEIKI